MADRFITVVVRPVGPGNLTVEDAMRQVLDTFKLLERTTARPTQWRLIEAKTNSPPFSVTAEAENETLAVEQKQEFARALNEIKNSRIPDTWDDIESLDIVKDLINRVKSGATLEVRGVSDAPITLSDKEAISASEVIEVTAEQPDTTKTKNQLGSIEGRLETIESYYDKPAVKLRERKTNARITCVLDEMTAKQFAQVQNFRDVWAHRRVVIRGLIVYNRKGRLLRVIATSVAPVDVRDVSVEQIQDPDFTGGLSSAEYLRKLRDGELGTDS